MLYLSKTLGCKVYGKKANFIGTLKDFTVSLHNGYPPVTGLVLKTSKEEMILRWDLVNSIEESQVLLSATAEELKTYCPGQTDIYLSRDVMDKQIFDIEDRKLIRVQDIQLARIDGYIRAIAVDVSIRAIVRRLGFEALVSGFKQKMQPKLIDWKSLSFLGVEDHDIKLRVMSKKVEMLHPADIADIVSELSPEHRTEILQALDEEIAADTIEELDPKYQASAISGLDSKKASEILEEMEPDEAADVIADLPKKKAQELLSLMEADEALEIKQLLKFPEDSAGGIMTTDYVVVREDFSAQECMVVIREQGRDIGTIAYIYVVDKEGVLIGVFSLKDLIMAGPNDVVKDFMHQSVIAVTLLEEQTEVAKLVAKYDILAVPVVDDKKRIKGIVTIDDALDVIIPTKWKKRFPRIY